MYNNFKMHLKRNRGNTYYAETPSIKMKVDNVRKVNTTYLGIFMRPN